jgi:ATP-binding cassette subfamily B protein
MSEPAPDQGLFRQELQLIGRRARTVWGMVPGRMRWALGGALAVMTLGSLANTAIPLLLGSLVNIVQAGTVEGMPTPMLLRAVWTALGFIALAVLVREALQVLRRYLVENTCTRIEKHLSVRVVSHLLQTDLSQIAHEKVGALHGRVFRSVDGYMRFLRMGFLDFIPALLTGLFALAAAVTKHPLLGLAMAGVIPASLALTAWQLVSQKGVRLRLLRVREELDGTVVEQLGGIDYIRAANTRELEVKRVSRVAENRRSQELRHHIWMAFFGAAKALTEGTFHIIVLATASYLAVHGMISFGDILTFSVLYLNVMAPLNEVHRVIDEGHEAALRVGDLIDILDRPSDPSFDAKPADEPLPDDSAPVIEVEGLTVDYTGADGKPRRALDGMSVCVRRGETLGVAGRSGGGKSTWLKVLMRLVHPTAGRVRVRGVPLEKVSRETLARLVGYVGQSPFVFAGTVEENITYGCGGGSVPREDVIRAARKAGLHDEILAMPAGYATQLAERGANLSGGQRQRLALARVFLLDPPILVLDEATSALDTISERQVQQAIDLARTDRTVIMVAHRLSTIADADRVLVFSDGRVAEEGPFQELAQRGGLLTELVVSAEGESSPVRQAG